MCVGGYMSGSCPILSLSPEMRVKVISSCAWGVGFWTPRQPDTFGNFSPGRGLQRKPRSFQRSYLPTVDSKLKKETPVFNYLVLGLNLYNSEQPYHPGHNRLRWSCWARTNRPLSTAASWQWSTYWQKIARNQLRMINIQTQLKRTPLPMRTDNARSLEN